MMKKKSHDICGACKVYPHCKKCQARKLVDIKNIRKDNNHVD